MKHFLNFMLNYNPNISNNLKLNMESRGLIPDLNMTSRIAQAARAKARDYKLGESMRRIEALTKSESDKSKSENSHQHLVSLDKNLLIENFERKFEYFVENSKLSQFFYNLKFIERAEKIIERIYPSTPTSSGQQIKTIKINIQTSRFCAHCLMKKVT